MNLSDFIISEPEQAAALAAALYRFGTEQPHNVAGLQRGLLLNYAYQRDRLARVAAQTATQSDLDTWPDDEYIKRDHGYVAQGLSIDPEHPAVRRFHLVRDMDETGISGTGIVAEGVEMIGRGGGVAMYWRTAHSSACFYKSIEAVEAIHGHGGKTRIVYSDGA